MTKQELDVLWELRQEVAKEEMSTSQRIRLDILDELKNRLDALTTED